MPIRLAAPHGESPHRRAAPATRARRRRCARPPRAGRQQRADQPTGREVADVQDLLAVGFVRVRGRRTSSRRFSRSRQLSSAPGPGRRAASGRRPRGPRAPRRSPRRAPARCGRAPHGLRRVQRRRRALRGGQAVSPSGARSARAGSGRRPRPGRRAACAAGPARRAPRAACRAAPSSRRASTRSRTVVFGVKAAAHRSASAAIRSGSAPAWPARRAPARVTSGRVRALGAGRPAALGQPQRPERAHQFTRAQPPSERARSSVRCSP